MVPDFKGFEVCQELKSDPFTSDVPIIFLTARYELSMFMKGFEVGGEDYIRKPLIMSELVSRVKAQIELASTRKIQLDLILELQKAKDEIKELKNSMSSRE
jgi:DNA-binding response OmpR family regulator